MYYVCVVGGEGEITLGVPVVEADDRVGDRDHQDVYRESPIQPRVCCFGAGIDIPLPEHAQHGDPLVFFDPIVWFSFRV